MASSNEHLSGRPPPSFDPRTLFETRRAPSAFESHEDEFESILRGSKGLHFRGGGPQWPPGEARPDQAEIEKVAFGKGLPVTVDYEIENIPDPVKVANTYVARHDQNWRIPALNALRQTLRTAGWSFALEHTFSRILGYSKTQISDWLRASHRSRAAFGGIELNVLAHESQIQKIEYLGWRAFPPLRRGHLLHPFVMGPGTTIKEKAFHLLPDDFALLRVVVRASCLFDLVSEAAAKQLLGAFTCDATALNRALLCNIELLGQDGWILQNE